MNYIRYCKILRKLIKETKKQHYNRLTAKSNKIKTTWIIIKKETRKIHLLEQVPTLVVNDEKLKIQQTWPMPSVISL